MSDFIDNLFARSLGQLEPIKPRLPSVYEDWDDQPDSEQSAEPIEFADSGIASNRQGEPDSQIQSDKVVTPGQADILQPRQSIDHTNNLPKMSDGQPSRSEITPQIQQSFIEQNETNLDVKVNQIQPEPVISVPTVNQVSSPVQRIIEQRNIHEVTEAQIESQPIQPAPLKIEREDRVSEDPPSPNSVVKVSIGRIQVQVPPATTSAKPQFASVTRRPKFRPSMSLDDYMDKRGR